MIRCLAASWLRRLPFCFICDKRTLLEHHHHDVHNDGWWLR